MSASVIVQNQRFQQVEFMDGIVGRRCQYLTVDDIEHIAVILHIDSGDSVPVFTGVGKLPVRCHRGSVVSPSKGIFAGNKAGDDVKIPVLADQRTASWLRLISAWAYWAMSCRRFLKAFRI